MPRPGKGAAHAEDDGWVLALVYDAASDASNVTVLDARDLSAGPCNAQAASNAKAEVGT